VLLSLLAKKLFFYFFVINNNRYALIERFCDLFIKCCKLATFKGAGRKFEMVVVKCGILLPKACQHRIEEAIEWRRCQPIVFAEENKVDLASVEFLGELFNKTGEAAGVVLSICKIIRDSALDEKKKRMNNSLNSLESHLEKYLAKFLNGILISYNLPKVKLIDFDEWEERAEEREREEERERKETEKREKREAREKEKAIQKEKKKRRIALIPVTATATPTVEVEEEEPQKGPLPLEVEKVVEKNIAMDTTAEWEANAFGIGDEDDSDSESENNSSDDEFGVVGNW